jgi:hypothetical protein
MTTPEPAPAEAELVGLVLRALEGAGGPLSASALARTLPRPLKRDAKALTPLLDEQARRGRWHRFAKGKTVSYGLEPPDAVARRAVLGAVAGEPRSWADLKKTPGLKGASKWLTAKALDAARDALLREGRFYEWPKAGGRGSIRYATRPADPHPYLGKALAAFGKELAKVAGSLARAGVGLAEVESAALGMLQEALGAVAPAPEAPAAVAALFPVAEGPTTPPVASDLAALVFDRMSLEDPAAATGAPVPLRNLRRALTFHLPEWATFESVLVGLAEAGLVALHRHDHPAGLSDAERAELVPDGQGGFYTAVSRRA